MLLCLEGAVGAVVGVVRFQVTTAASRAVIPDAVAVAGAVVEAPDADADAVAVGGIGAVVEPPRELVLDAVAAVVPEAAEGAVGAVRAL